EKKKREQQFFVEVLMAGSDNDDQLECKETNNISTILASEGVEFLLNGEEKVGGFA
ncbi:hypothetical protein U1Q18_036341, partial [Sarracenia purpurea var. burkii]